MEHKDFKPLYILGVGKTGAHIASLLYHAGVEAEYALIGNHKNVPDKVRYIHFKSPRKPLVPGNNMIMVPDMSIEHPLPALLNDILKQDYHFLILAGLGGYTGTVFTVKIAQHLTFYRRKFTTIVSLPYWFEGIRRSQSAATALSDLFGMQDINVVKLDRLNRNLNLTVNLAFKYADLKMLDVVNQRFRFGFNLPVIENADYPIFKEVILNDPPRNLSLKSLISSF